jgi:hypothetical protein
MAEFTRFGKLSSDRKTEKVTVSTITTAGDVTLTAAQLLGGLILRDPNGAARADIWPTAALICAAIDNVAIGDSFYAVIKNTADANETITMTDTASSTCLGTKTVTQNNTKVFLVVVTAVATPTVVIYSLGTMVH